MKKIISIIIIFILFINFPIVVFADDSDEENISKEEIQNQLIEVSSEIEDIPKTSSRSVLILDKQSKIVLYEKNGYSKRAMASTTKIMSAIVILENSKLTDVVEVSKKAGGTGGSRLGIKAGDKVTVNDLLYGLLLRSRK